MSRAMERHRCHLSSLQERLPTLPGCGDRERSPIAPGEDIADGRGVGAMSAQSVDRSCRELNLTPRSSRLRLGEVRLLADDTDEAGHDAQRSPLEVDVGPPEG